MRRPLVFPLLVVLFWMSFALIAPYFAPWDPSVSENIIKVETPEGTMRYYSPHPPSPRHLLGTDEYGYDLLTFMLYGSRFSVFLVRGTAIVRTALVLLIGVIRGFSQRQGSKGTGSRQRKTTSGRFSLIDGVPAFIIIYFILFGFVFNPELDPITMTLLQGVLMVIFGLRGPESIFRERTALLMGEPFIEAARSCGGRRSWILSQHILPHLTEEIVSVFARETVSVLTLIGQLGIFSIFIGGTRMTPDPLELTSITHEWGGLIGRYMGKLGTSHSWLILYPLAAYLLLFISAYAASRKVEQAKLRQFHRTSYL